MGLGYAQNLERVLLAVAIYFEIWVKVIFFFFFFFNTRFKYYRDAGDEERLAL